MALGPQAVKNLHTLLVALLQELQQSGVDTGTAITANMRLREQRDHFKRALEEIANGTHHFAGNPAVWDPRYVAEVALGAAPSQDGCRSPMSHGRRCAKWPDCVCGTEEL